MNTKKTNINKEFIIDYLASLVITYAAEMEHPDDVSLSYIGVSGGIFAIQEALTSEEMDYIRSLPLYQSFISNGINGGNIYGRDLNIFADDVTEEVEK